VAPLGRWLEHAFVTGRVLPVLVVTIATLVFGFAVLMRVIDPDGFPTLGSALWWAVATVTTVGYGDVVPSDALGRGVASLLLITGFAFLSLVTGTIASALVARRTSRRDQAEEALELLRGLDRRLAEVERRLGGDETSGAA
jgi:voltage-gated potassium channel Kch